MICGYGVSEFPPEWLEEYERIRAARYLGVPPWDDRLDQYYINLAIACQAAESEAQDHLSHKD